MTPGIEKRQTTAPGSPIGPLRRLFGGGRVRTATDGRDILHNDPDGWEVSQPWLWWTGPAGGDGTGGPFGNPPPGADGTGVVSTIPAVARCTSIICDTIAGLPWHIFRDDYEQLATPAWIEDPQALRVDGRVVDPGVLEDVRLSAVEFWTNWITAALWFGDGFLYVPVRDEMGAPKPPIWQIHPRHVKIEAGSYWVGDGEVPLPADTIIHLRGEPPYWSGRGSGVVDRHGLDLGFAAVVRQYASQTFATGVPAGYLKSHQPSMTADQAAQLRDVWMAQHGGRRTIAVLNSTTEFQPIAISPVDAQLDLAQTAAMRAIALAFGVPPYMLGVPGDSSTYANVESRMIELRQFTLLPWQRRIESVLDAQLPRGTELKIRTDGLLRADTSARYSAYQTAITAGFMTVDEVRRLEDLAPLELAGGVT